nr:immunoglobulin heavy chain junction region [Mus musculus]MBK4197652.1 immunoglobulin heavy chain junction region [Mus musculus]MBK4197653.1 immunoglobulin heavy chain junction region [Mus musculus]MBK4197654.1 immunoglobulin heavy chain junction region [Mus musculus]MBK4197655.1 immunoglobulin heavy chain junction region [Mus musculus]
CARPSYYGLHW